MKGIIAIAILVLSVFLMGCNNNTTPSSLNTDILTKVKSSGMKSDPIDYKTDSVKDALKALPFEMDLPAKLPFKSKGFQMVQIQDFKHDGKSIIAHFTAFSNDTDNIIQIEANNFNSTYEGGAHEKVKLKNGITGDYSGGNSLTFKSNDIIYNIVLTYNDGSESPTQHKKDLIDLANQMIR